MRHRRILGEVDLGETGHLLAGNRSVSPRSTSAGAMTAGLTRCEGHPDPSLPWRRRPYIDQRAELSAGACTVPGAVSFMVSGGLRYVGGEESQLVTTVEQQVNEDFLRLADPFRQELLAHCYRMLGSVHDAEDLVQETYLRAWRAYDNFEGRSSLRTWLYRIATRVCLTALESRNRRVLPTGLGAPNPDAEGVLVEQPDMPWLEPAPDGMVGLDPNDPASIVSSRESIRLAFIAALQHLPPRQRAVLILRDVLKWRASEVAHLLDTTPTAVNSLLQRARAHLDEVAPTEDDIAEPPTAEQRELLDRYVKAFEEYDVAGLVELFQKDAVWEMPPFLDWFEGPENVGLLFKVQCPAGGPGDLRLVATEANGQPAFGMYLRDSEGVHRPFSLHVLDFGPTGIRHVVSFFDTSLFPLFNLPETLSDRSTAVTTSP
jgi:RNA polymerase sigma-70 factor (ECF subfamily)